MAPWSSWFQSASQQQKEQQRDSSPSSPPPMTSPPSSPNQTPALPSTEPLTPKIKKRDYREMPSPTELREIGAKSLQTGMVTGGFGLLVGAGSGIMRSAPPALFAVFAGLQWFTLGSTYIASRGLLHHAWGGEENLSSLELVAAGGIAGGVSGMVGGMIRGPRNVLPGIFVFGTLGAGSSYVSQLLRGTGSAREKSWLDSKWSPMQRLSDKDYLDKVEDKILRLDADIAIIDDNIASLKKTLHSPAPSPNSTK
ncbi:hypothetical protein F5B22DRAFT_582570 [Xylaria bambusicola]|uniref:uncharacterized protein n=1 Tax=Xylaria bambusicola TaxID=326684 RepID=UPI002007EB17|nr:uncharacterized protein F5B22DRAFT_582570 [Xylaria bambusicola]KAI0527853.1 hypothetical protein F5B22DRAFT_582570 [Xylaria bambusicola]